MFAAPKVTAAYRARVLKVVAGHKPDTNFQNPQLSDLIIAPKTKKEIIDATGAVPRTVRRTFKELCDEGLIVEHSSKMLNTPSGRSDIQTYQINTQMLDEVLYVLRIDTRKSAIAAV